MHGFEIDKKKIVLVSDELNEMIGWSILYLMCISSVEKQIIVHLCPLNANINDIKVDAVR